MPDKVIVSNRGALAEKYKKEGAVQIFAAISDLVAADRERGIETEFVALDDADVMTALGGAPVVFVNDERANKAAIDAVYQAKTPDYLMILGAIDIVPHQELTNPVFNILDPLADGDRRVPSDLPYACDAPFSRSIANFVAPSRVIGRLPDLTGRADLKYILELLDHAREAKAVEKTPPFGISAQAWEGSTNASLRALFGNDASAASSPKHGPQWADEEFKRPWHFINCHGASTHSQFHGDPGPSPVAHDAKWIDGQSLRPGTVAAVECCYGAELYDPGLAGGQMSIGNTYLRLGASAYFGSTTIAYGPAEENSHADVICGLFLKAVLDGRSTGDAALAARLGFVEQAGTLDPIELKTLAQFILLGDPSIHPVAARAEAAAADEAATVAASAPTIDVSRNGRKTRRAEARETARHLDGSVSVGRVPIGVPDDVADRMTKAAEDVKLSPRTMRSFAAAARQRGPGRTATGADVAAPQTTRVHMLLGERADSEGDRMFDHPVAIVMKDGDLTPRVLYGKA